MSGEGGDWNSVNSAYNYADRNHLDRPRFYLYNSKTKNLIYYTPFKNRIFKKTVKNFKDLITW